MGHHTTVHEPASRVGMANNIWRATLPVALQERHCKHKVIATKAVNEAFHGRMAGLLKRIVEFPDAAFDCNIDPFGDRDVLVLDMVTPQVLVKIDPIHGRSTLTSPSSPRSLTLMLPDEY